MKLLDNSDKLESSSVTLSQYIALRSGLWLSLRGSVDCGPVNNLLSTTGDHRSSLKIVPLSLFGRRPSQLHRHLRVLGLLETSSIPVPDRAKLRDTVKTGRVITYIAAKKVTSIVFFLFVFCCCFFFWGGG